MSNYTTKTIPGYMGSNGFMGCNHGKYHGSGELKTMLLNDFKKCGIKGVSLRFHRGGYTTAFTVNVKATRNDTTLCDRKYYQWNQYREYHQDFTKDFNDKMRLIIQIVNSYNYDKSNSMVDYFDTAFYDNYEIKIMD